MFGDSMRKSKNKCVPFCGGAFNVFFNTNGGEEIGFIPIFFPVAKYEFGVIVICICISFPNY